LWRLSRFKRQKDTSESDAVKEEQEKTLVRQVFDAVLYMAACLLIFGGLAVLIWILRPYAVLYLRPAAKAELDKKANSGVVTDNRIIIPSVLVDAPIFDGVTARTLHDGVAHDSSSVYPGEKGNCIIEGHNLAEIGFLKPMSFFSLMEVVGEGAPVYVFYKGKKHTYEVAKKKKLDVSNPELRRRTQNEQLTLITCVSTWSVTIYTSKRMVVICLPAKRSEF